MATIAANPEYDDLGQGLNFYDELTTDRFDEIDDRIKSILGNNNLKIIDTIDITNEQLLENGLDLKSAKYTPEHLSEVTQALLVAAAPPLPPPDKDETIGFMFPPVMRRRMTNSTASKEAIYRLRKQALAVIEASQWKAEKEYREFLVQVRYLAGATLAVTGTCAVAFVVITMGAPALLSYAFETGLMGNVYFQGTIIPMLESFFPFTITQLQELRTIMTNFQTIGEGPLKELFQKIKDTGKNIFTIDEAAIDAIATATPALQKACDALKSFKILILIQFINTEEFAAFEKKSGKAYTALKSVAPQLLNAILTRDITKLATPDAQQFLEQVSEITPMFTQFLGRLKFVFDKAQMVIKFATAKDSTEMYRYLAEGPANIFLQSRYTQISVRNAIDKRLESALVTFGIPLGNNKLWSIRPIKIVGEGIERMSFGAISADTTGSILTFLTPNGEQIRGAFSHGINSTIFNGANQTVRMITTNILGIKDKPATKNTGPDDDDTNSPKSKRRRELLEKGLSGDALIKILNDEFGGPEEIVGPDADLVKGLSYEFGKFWKGLTKNWRDAKSPQARLLSILFTGTIGTCIFTELFIDPSKGPGESTTASFLYMVDPLIKLLKNFIVTFTLYDLGSELMKTISLAEGLLIELSNRVRHSLGFLNVYITKVKNSTTVKNNTLLKIGLDIIGTIVTIFEGVGSLFWNYAINNNISSIATMLTDNSLNVHTLINAFTMNNVYDILDRCHQFFRKKGQEVTFSNAFDFAREIIRLDRSSNIRAPIDILETNTDNCYTDIIKSIEYQTIKQFVKMIPGGAEIPPYNCLKVSDAVVHFNNFHMIYTGAEGEKVAKDTTARRAYLLLLSMGQRMNPPKSLEDLLNDPEILEILRVMGIKCYSDETVQPTDVIRKPEDISIESIRAIATSIDSKYPTILEDYRKDLGDELVSQLLKTGFFGKTKEEVFAKITDEVDPNIVFNPTLNPVITGILSPENQMDVFGEMIQYANFRISENVFRDSILSLFEGKPKEKLFFSFLNEGGETEYMTVNNADPNFMEINLAEIDSYGTKAVGVLSPDTQRLVHLFGRDGIFRAQAEDILRTGDKIYLNKQSDAKNVKETFDKDKKGIILGNNLLKFEKVIIEFITKKFDNEGYVNEDVKILDKYNEQHMVDYDKTFNGKVTRFLKSFVDMYDVPIFYNGFGGAEQVTQEEIQGAAEYVRTLPHYMEGKIEEDLTTDKILEVLKTNLPLRNRLIGYMREKTRLHHIRQAQELVIEYDVDGNLPGAFNTLNLNSSGKFKELMEHMFSSFDSEIQTVIDSDPDIIKYKAESPKPSEYYLRIIEILQYKGRYDDVRSLLIFLHLGFTATETNDAFLQNLTKSVKDNHVTPKDVRGNLRQDIPDFPQRNVQIIQPLKPSGITSVITPQPGAIIQEELSILDDSKKLLLNVIKGIGDKRLPFLIKNPFISGDLKSKIIISSEVRRVLKILNGEEVNNADYEKRTRPTVNHLAGTGEDYQIRKIEYYSDLNEMFSYTRVNLIVQHAYDTSVLIPGAFSLLNDEMQRYKICIQQKLVSLNRDPYSMEIDDVKSSVKTCMLPLLEALDSDIKSNIQERMDAFDIKLLTSKVLAQTTELIVGLESTPEGKQIILTPGSIETKLKEMYTSIPPNELEKLKQMTIAYNKKYNKGLPEDKIPDIPESIQNYINIRRGQVENENKKEPLEKELGGIKIDLTFWQRLLSAWSKTVNGIVKIETPSSAPDTNKGPAKAPGHAPAGPGVPGAPGKGQGQAKTTQNQEQAQAKGKAESESLGSLLREGQELGLVTETSPPIEKNEESLIERLTESLMNMLANLFDVFNRIGANTRNRESRNGKNPFQPTSGTTATETDVKRETGFDQKCIELRDNYIIKGNKAEWITRPADLPENFNLQLCLKKGFAPKSALTIIDIIKTVMGWIVFGMIQLTCAPLIITQYRGRCVFVLNVAYNVIVSNNFTQQNNDFAIKIRKWKNIMSQNPNEPFDANRYFARDDASMEDMRDFMLITILMISNQGSATLIKALYGESKKEYNIFGYYKPTATSQIGIASATAHYGYETASLGNDISNLMTNDSRNINDKINTIIGRIPKLLVGDIDVTDITAPAYYGDKGGDEGEETMINPWRVFLTFMKKQVKPSKTSTQVVDEFVQLMTTYFTGIYKKIIEEFNKQISDFFTKLPDNIVFDISVDEQDNTKLKATMIDSSIVPTTSHIFRRQDLTSTDIKNIYKELIKLEPGKFETVLSQYPEWTTRTNKENKSSNDAIIDTIIDRYRLFYDKYIGPGRKIDDDIWKTIFMNNGYFMLHPPVRREPPPILPPISLPPPILNFIYDNNNTNNIRDLFSNANSILRQANENIKKGLSTKDLMGLYLPYNKNGASLEEADFGTNYETNTRWRKSIYPEDYTLDANIVNELWNFTNEEFINTFTEKLDITFNKKRYPLLLNEDVTNNAKLWEKVKDKYQEKPVCIKTYDGQERCIYILKKDIELAGSNNRLGGKNYEDALINAYFSKLNSELRYDDIANRDANEAEFYPEYDFSLFTEQNKLSFFDLSVIITSSNTHPDVSVEGGLWKFNVIKDDVNNLEMTFNLEQIIGSVWRQALQKLQQNRRITEETIQKCTSNIPACSRAIAEFSYRVLDEVSKAEQGFVLKGAGNELAFEAADVIVDLVFKAPSAAGEAVGVMVPVVGKAAVLVAAVVADAVVQGAKAEQEFVVQRKGDNLAFEAADVIVNEVAAGVERVANVVRVVAEGVAGAAVAAFVAEEKREKEEAERWVEKVDWLVAEAPAAAAAIKEVAAAAVVGAFKVVGEFIRKKDIKTAKQDVYAAKKVANTAAAKVKMHEATKFQTAINDAKLEKDLKDKALEEAIAAYELSKTTLLEDIQKANADVVLKQQELATQKAKGCRQKWGMGFIDVCQPLQQELDKAQQNVASLKVQEEWIEIIKERGDKCINIFTLKEVTCPTSPPP